MKRQRKLHNALLLIASLLIIFMAGGCGGGGGGGGGGGSPTGSYSGLTSQAVITEENSTDLMDGAFMGGEAGSSMSVFGSVQVQPSLGSRHPVTIAFSRMIMHAVNKWKFSSQANVPATASALIPDLDETVDGECGGSYTIGGDVNALTGDISNGTIVYNGFCDAGVTLTGTVLFSGQIDPITEEMNLDFTFDDVTVTESDISGTIAGTAAYDVGIDTGSMTFKDIYIHDNSLSKTYWFHDFVIAGTDESSSYSMTIDGRYYDPDYGYIDFSTEEPFTILTDDENPSDGVLVAQGRDGTKARLTALSSTTYMVEADTNGDGTFEWNSEILYW
jgi:hypothetical protein